jgi:hypothetical protein
MDAAWHLEPLRKRDQGVLSGTDLKGSGDGEEEDVFTIP